MPKAVEIRGIQEINGAQYIAFTWGTPPLPNAATAEVSYESVAAMKEKIAKIEERIREEGLVLLHLAITYLRPDGTLANLNQVLNKTLTLDPCAAQPLMIT